MSELKPYPRKWLASEYLDDGRWGVLNEDNQIILGVSLGLDRKSAEIIANRHNNPENTCAADAETSALREINDILTDRLKKSDADQFKAAQTELAAIRRIEELQMEQDSLKEQLLRAEAFVGALKAENERLLRIIATIPPLLAG